MRQDLRQDVDPEARALRERFAIDTLRPGLAEWLAARMPFVPCVGWDLVKLEDGWTCLEGNPMPGYHVRQVHGGVLRAPRARRFYREFGMLR